MYGVDRKRSSHTTQQRPDDACNTPGCADESHVFSTVLEGDDVRNGNLHELEDASTADTLNRPGDHEPDHTLRGSA